jgi:acyl-CoA synthetase (AMP-forming)/AMP-acid ligase II
MFKEISSARLQGDAMVRRWYKVWPHFVPKVVDVERPACEYIREWASRRPSGIALSYYGRDMTYGELNETIDRFARGLTGLGLKKGDRVALFMQNCPQFVISFFGIHRAGGVVVSLNPMFKQAELEYQINDAGAETLLALNDLYPEAEKIKGRTPIKRVILTSLKDYLPTEPSLPLLDGFKDSDQAFSETVDFLELLDKGPQEPICDVGDLHEDPAIIQYTGGTTGLPKGAVISHYALCFAGLGDAMWQQLRYDDVTLGITPFFHVMGLAAVLLATLVAGGRLIVLPRFVPEITAQAIEHYKCTYWVAASTMLISLLRLPDARRFDLSSLRLLVTGGAPVSQEIQERVRELAPKAFIGEGYGLSETCASGGLLTPLFGFKPGFVGTPHFCDMKVMDAGTGTKELPVLQEGEIVIKGPSMMEGYWNRPEETERVLRNGWLYTGDLGLMDEEGYFKILGRKKELIICSGFNVYPPDVENRLYRHPAIAETAVIGIPDPYRGESPKAFVVLHESHKGKTSEEDILLWCKENMAAYKRPSIIEFRDELPKSGAGKILKRILEGENI